MLRGGPSIKTLIASEQDRPDVATARSDWRASQRDLDPTRLIFIDETWTKTNMTRPMGRAERGKRVVSALGSIITCFAPAGCANYFRNAGYFRSG
jgi:hypothetical protein